MTTTPKPTLDERSLTINYRSLLERADALKRTGKEIELLYVEGAIELLNKEKSTIAEMQAEIDELKELTSGHKSEEMFWFKRAKEYEAEIERLQIALGEAQVVIHDEFCGYEKHHNVCDRVRKALEGQNEKES